MSIQIVPMMDIKMLCNNCNPTRTRWNLGEKGNALINFTCVSSRHFPSLLNSTTSKGLMPPVGGRLQRGRGRGHTPFSSAVASELPLPRLIAEEFIYDLGHPQGAEPRRPATSRNYATGRYHGT